MIIVIIGPGLCTPTTPNLFIKGEESHYPVKPCKYYAKIIKEQGNNIEFLIIPKVNHFFSFNGTIVKGIAVNGCPDNIAFRYPDGSWKFADGTPSTRRKVNKRCLGDKAGSGKTREKLDLAVDYTFKFFNKLSWNSCCKSLMLEKVRSNTL